MMNEYPERKALYVGVNAHLLIHFSQVLSFYYPNHNDHFHIDFNGAHRFNTESMAKTLLLQSALKYVFGKELGGFGPDRDGIDGNYGDVTADATAEVLAEAGLANRGGLTKSDVWNDFLRLVRNRTFQ